MGAKYAQRPAAIPPRAWHAVWMSCARKVRHATLEAAEAARVGPEQVAYRCAFSPDDPHWHLTRRRTR